jgi:hypothetical protein
LLESGDLKEVVGAATGGVDPKDGVGRLADSVLQQHHVQGRLGGLAVAVCLIRRHPLRRTPRWIDVYYTQYEKHGKSYYM